MIEHTRTAEQNRPQVDGENDGEKPSSPRQAETPDNGTADGIKRNRSKLHDTLTSPQIRERGRMIASQEISLIHNPLFDQPKAVASLTVPPHPAAKKPNGSASASKGMDAYITRLYEVPLLTREEEIALFLCMNYHRYRASVTQRRLDPEGEIGRLRTVIDSIEYDLAQATVIRNRIAEANLRLVFATAKKFASVGSTEFDDFHSEGYTVLLRAIDHFDVARGTKFGTYATWSLIRGMVSMKINEARSNRWKQSEDGKEFPVDAIHDYRETEEQTHEREQNDAARVATVKRLLRSLTVRERNVIERRFGLDGDTPPTLRDLGWEMGVSKERARQLQERALVKLRAAAGQESEDA